MKNQIKSLFVIILMAISFHSNSQSLTIVAGGNYTNLNYNQGSGTALEDSYKSIPGFHVGGYLDYVVIKDKRQEIVLEAGLLFDTKGTKNDYIIGDFSNKETLNLYYLDLPIYIGYRYRFRNLNKIHFGIGPYAGFGLFGNSIKTQTLGGVTTEDKVKIKWGGDNEYDDLKRLDYGVSAKAGFYFDRGLDISVSYDYGLPNIASMGSTIEMNNRVLRFSIGYTFSLDD